jgi:hypothetical protein
MHAEDDDARQLIARSRLLRSASQQKTEELQERILMGHKLIEHSKILLERCRPRYPWRARPAKISK